MKIPASGIFRFLLKSNTSALEASPATQRPTQHWDVLEEWRRDRFWMRLVKDAGHLLRKRRDKIAEFVHFVLRTALFSTTEFAIGW